MNYCPLKAHVSQRVGFFFYKEKGIFYQTHMFLGAFIKHGVKQEKRVVKWVSIDEINEFEIPRESRKFIEEVHKNLRNKVKRTDDFL